MNEDQIINQALEILEARLATPNHYFSNPNETKSYLVMKLAELEHEVFSALFLDNQHGLIGYTELFRGTIDGASVYPREVVKEALDCNAAAVIFAHNHPSGVAEPSEADKRITAKLKSALALVDIRVLDHIIVANTNTMSLAENGLL